MPALGAVLGKRWLRKVTFILIATCSAKRLSCFTPCHVSDRQPFYFLEPDGNRLEIYTDVMRVPNGESFPRQEYAAMLDALTRATGVAPLGWLGPAYGESTRAPQLLAQVGIRYVCDWVNDEPPYPLKTPQGDLLAFPITLPLDDVNALWDRRVPIRS